MSFGFSVGDFIAISGVIRTLVDALDSNTGSRAQYSRLSDELKSLHSAFLAVQDVMQKLRRDEKSHSSTINAITYEIGCCQKLILGFTADTEKYRESLCHGSGRKVKDTWRKISYKIFKDEDVVMLKDSLRRRVEAINLLLLVAGIRSVFSLEDKVSGIELVVRQQPAKIPKELGCGIEGSIILQDALGRTFPVPFVVCATSEMFHGFLELSFRGLPGHQKVLSREYSVSDECQKDITSTEWVENITPGRLVSMSMLFRHIDNAPGATDFKSKCPSCKTPGAFSAGGSSRGWTQCKFCQLWTQHSKEYPAETPIGVLGPRPPPSPLLPSDVSAISKELSSFRRVKIVEISRFSYLLRTQPQSPRPQLNPMLTRYMTLGRDKPLQYMANIATQGGRARDDEYLVHQRGMEEEWLSVSESEGSGSVTESSVTPGREQGMEFLTNKAWTDKISLA